MLPIIRRGNKTSPLREIFPPFVVMRPIRKIGPDSDLTDLIDQGAVSGYMTIEY